MNMPVVAVSGHGSTAVIATAIGEALKERGLAVTVAPVEGVQSVEGYEAFVMGSAVSAGQTSRKAATWSQR